MLYKIWQNAPWNQERWPHFSRQELSCHCQGRYCAGEYWHDPLFLDALQALRHALKGPVLLTSAHRCRLWNAHVGGVPLSQHKKIAADICLQHHGRKRLYHTARRLGFSGFGFYQTFLHLDKGPPRFWFGGSHARTAWQGILSPVS